MKEERHCATCANWIPEQSGPSRGNAAHLATLGECHRYAPQPLLLAHQAAIEAQLVWPKTRAVDRCGEWYFGGLRLEEQEAPEPMEVQPATAVASDSPPSMTPPRRSTL